MQKLVLTYFLTLFFSLTFSQTIDTFKVSGIVISANSDEAIPDGIIKVSKIKGYKCDRLGHFTLYNLSKGKHKLSFSAIGFEDRDTVINIVDENITDFKWPIYTNCWKYSTSKALKDIKDNKPTILLQGGIAPLVYKTDKEFEKKYMVSFHDFGCVAGDNEECLIAYNKTIFEYLDKTYGKKWRKEIRKDAIGLRNK